MVLASISVAVAVLYPTILSGGVKVSFKGLLWMLRADFLESSSSKYSENSIGSNVS